MTNARELPTVHIEKKGADTLLLQFGGRWRIGQNRPSFDQCREALDPEAGIRRIHIDADRLSGWDSAILTFLVRLEQFAGQHDVEIDRAGLPEGIQRLLALASAVPERKDAHRESDRKTLTYRAGERVIDLRRSNRKALFFIGEAFLAFLKFVTGRARFRRSDLLLFIQQSGMQALPIVSLISVLVGLILAFIGAVQLAMFGAQIYIASLVGIAMIRVMGAVMTGVIMAGRTGAAFAAQLGTMTVNEEIDALITLGISPIEFLVLPRMLALFIMMPLLCLYADLMGVLGGLIVGIYMLDLNFWEYINMTRSTVQLSNFWIGLVHAAVFGILVALAGCLRGMQCGRSASAVGQAATSAVVTGIVSIVIATAIITVLCNIIGV